MTALEKKLHLKTGMKMCVLDAPAGYQASLKALPTTQVKALKGELDVLQIFVTRKAQLEKRLAALKKSMHEKSMLWVCYPKANGLGTDLNRDLLRVWLEEKGLISVAQIAIDDVWSAIRFKLEEQP